MRTLLQSEAVRAGPATAFGDARDELAQLLQLRLDGVMRLKDSKLLLFQAQRTALPELLALLPDAEPPTVLQVDGADTLALQALCHGEMTWQPLEAPTHAGAPCLMGVPGGKMMAWGARPDDAVGATWKE